MTTLRAAIAIGLGAIALTGCDRSAASGTGGQSSQAAEVGLPAGLFVASAPGSAVSLIDAKSQAKAGDRVVFQARIGGRIEPFLESRAVFFVADSSLLSCDQMHEGVCKTPWDYCCGRTKRGKIWRQSHGKSRSSKGEALRARRRHGLKPSQLQQKNKES